MSNMYDPFESFRRFDRMFSEGARGTAMPMDLYRSGDTFTVRMDLPGVDPGSIDIDVDDRTLTVRAERHQDEHTEDATWVSRERMVGTYARQLTLGRGLALDKISADYRDGVLTLTIPVAEEAKPRKINVSHGGTGSSPAVEGTGTSGSSGSTSGAGSGSAGAQTVQGETSSP
ncbi:MAG: Hsp20/alpha crystallin family protein [Intrasporangium sp.]|uniref:Hsp20/alpha crystallin family protein n=1 Tax=Intrasporangium sp. TaxID=1925024 RepID=UPI003F7D4DE8